MRSSKALRSNSKPGTTEATNGPVLISKLKFLRVFYQLRPQVLAAQSGPITLEQRPPCLDSFVSSGLIARESPIILGCSSFYSLRVLSEAWLLGG